MKKLLLTAGGILLLFQVNSQCDVNNATGCQCPTGTATDCDLLPDITISWQGLEGTVGNCSGCGFIEYSQTSTSTTYSQGVNAGRLRVSGSTPNIGFGPFTVRGADANGYRHFVCGGDTFSIYDPANSQNFTCPNGNPNPRQLLTQRIYHKNGNAMSYWERLSGTMTYHPSHGHNHVDGWCVFTLRIQDPNEPDPRNWSIVGTGQKIGFCLMDYSDCSGYPGHCRDDNTVYQQGNTLLNADFPNWGLGGGQYNCSPVMQGISSGYTDVYGKHLDGMWINIPPNTCNGNYWIVIEVDPYNDFLESDETNNYTAIPVTLTQQQAPGSGQPVYITADRSNLLCQGETITLTATAGSDYLWSTGDTTQSITVSTPGNYTVEVTNYCGTGTSQPFIITQFNTPFQPTVSGDTICVSGNASLSASGSGTIKWYDSNLNYVATGNSYITPTLSSSTTYYAENVEFHNDTIFADPQNASFGSGGFLGAVQYLTFNSYSNFILKSVLVNAQSAGSVTIELQDSLGNAITSIPAVTATVPAGWSRVNLNFSIPANQSFRLVKTGTFSLYRNDGSVSYPYNLPNVLRITGSSAGAAYYYFFYDWEIVSTNNGCASTMMAVPVFVDACTGLGGNISFSNSLKLSPNPASQMVSISFETKSDDEVSYSITDLAGKTLRRESLGRAHGITSRNADLTGLDKGVYLVNLFFQGSTFTRKLVVE